MLHNDEPPRTNPASPLSRSASLRFVQPGKSQQTKSKEQGIEEMATSVDALGGKNGENGIRLSENYNSFANHDLQYIYRVHRDLGLSSWSPHVAVSPPPQREKTGQKRDNFLAASMIDPSAVPGAEDAAAALVALAELTTRKLRPRRNRAAIYARFSTKFQDSIQDQVRSCREWAKGKGLEVCEDMIFTDEAITGRSSRRAGFKAMVEALDANRFDVLVCIATSRIFRKAYKVMQFVSEKIVARGKRAVFISANIDTDERKRWSATLNLYGIMDEFVTGATIEQIHSAHIGNLLAQNVYGTLAFGYKGDPIPGSMRAVARLIIATCSAGSSVNFGGVVARPFCRVMDRQNCMCLVRSSVIRTSHASPVQRKRTSCDAILIISRICAAWPSDCWHRFNLRCDYGDLRCVGACTFGAACTTVVEHLIKPNNRLSSVERVEIYNRQYWFRLFDCLYDDFPGLRAVLGQRRFHALSRAYLAAHPSGSFTLRNLGHSLPAFVESHPNLSASRPNLATDMARFEWAQIEAFDGAARKRLASRDIARITACPARARIGLQPYLHLLRLRYPLDDFLLAVKKKTSTLRAEASNAVDVSAPRKRPPVTRLPRPQDIHLAVHRFDNALYYKRLTAEAFTTLQALRAGKTLKAALTAAFAFETDATASGPPLSASSLQDSVATIRDWFKTWAHLGWLCAFEKS